LPALEALHSAWSVRSKRLKYIDFREGLDAAIKKISEYYTKTAHSDAHIMAMHACLIFFACAAFFFAKYLIK